MPFSDLGECIECGKNRYNCTCADNISEVMRNLRTVIDFCEKKTMHYAECHSTIDTKSIEKNVEMHLVEKDPFPFMWYSEEIKKMLQRVIESNQRAKESFLEDCVCRERIATEDNKIKIRKEWMRNRNFFDVIVLVIQCIINHYGLLVVP